MYNPDMKWLAVLVGIGLSWLGGNGVRTTEVPAEVSEPVKKVVEFGEQSYEYLWHEVGEGQKMSVSVNLPEPVSSRKFLEKNECSALINGGFYATNMTPLGLIKDKDQIHSVRVKSSLLNGFFGWENTRGDVLITNDDEAASEYKIQTGPLLIIDGEKLPLAIKNDENRRRMVALMNSGGDLVFVGIREEDSSQMGPMLAELPEVVEVIAKKEGEVIKSAINLDGGSASVFYDGESYWSEIKPVGTYLCVR